LILLAAVITPAQNSVPLQVVGMWEGTTTSGMTFYDRGTGSYAAPSGEAQKYTIFPNGQYKREALMQNSLYNCTDAVFVIEVGHLRIEGATVIFNSTGADLESRDNCNQSFNYKKRIEPRSRTLGWRVDRDRWGVAVLFESGKDGELLPQKVIASPFNPSSGTRMVEGFSIV
jgi:hypothetical protein